MNEKFHEMINRLTDEMVKNLPDAFSEACKFRPYTNPEEFMEDIFASFQTKLDAMKEHMCDVYYDGEE